MSLVCARTNPWHHWLWTDIVPPSGDSPFAFYRYGWWFWVLTAHNYILMVATTVVLLGAIRRVGRHFRTAMTAVLIAVILPWIGNAAYNAKLGPWPGLNWLTLSLGISGSLLVWVVLREGLLDLLPQAPEALLEKMTDGVMILDPRGNVIFANQTARRMIDSEDSTLAPALGFNSLADAPESWRSEAEFEYGGVRRWIDVRIDAVRDRWGEAAGRLVVARDVTAQKALEDERERLIAALHEVLAEGLERERTREGGLSRGKLGEHFTVHGKAGVPCPVCGDDLKRVSYESHEVVYCPRCQTGGKVLADRRLSRLVK